jgi:hypothetical protein
MIEFLYLFGEYNLALVYTLIFQPFVPQQFIYLPLVILATYYYQTVNYLATGLLFAYALKAGKNLKLGETYAFVGDALTQFIGVKFDDKHTVEMPECMTVYEYIYQDFRNHFKLEIRDYSTTIIYVLFSINRNVLVKHVMSSLIGLTILIIIKYVQNYNNISWYYVQCNQTLLYKENHGKLLPYPVPIMVLASLIPELYFKLVQDQKFNTVSNEMEPNELSSKEVHFDENENLDLSESEPEFSEENE